MKKTWFLRLGDDHLIEGEEGAAHLAVEGESDVALLGFQGEFHGGLGRG